MRTLLLCALLVALSACGDPDVRATRALEDAGYSEITMTGWRFLGCDEKDWFRRGFEATGPSGRHVAGVVCWSPIKSATVRLD